MSDAPAPAPPHPPPLVDRDTSDTTVSLRYYAEIQIAHEREVRAMADSHERDVRQLTEKTTDLALKLQAAEYERRLDGLNGEQNRIQNVLEKSVPREVFEAYKDAEAKAINAFILEVRTWRAEISGALSLVRFMGFAGVVALILALLRLAGVLQAAP